jgi:16S rRNA (uracil1498-N3)-methyltransferase
MTHPRRFFVNPEKIHHGTAIIDGKEARHISTVLRLTRGDVIVLLDGTGRAYSATIETLSRDSIEARITEETCGRDDVVPFHLGIGLLKGKKMELVIQKATELGVRSLHPFTSRYSVAEPESDAKGQRWQRIVLEACKQSGRPAPLDCPPTTDFPGILDAAS